MFYFTYQTDEKVGEEELEEARVRSGGIKEFEENMVQGASTLRMSKGGHRVHNIWMVVWTNDVDGVGTDTPLMREIMEACDNKWAVKEVPNDYRERALIRFRR